MQDFWGPLRNRWPGDTPVLHWHILPGDDPAVAAMVSAYGGLTAHPGLDVVPARWLHQTLYMIAVTGAAVTGAAVTGGAVTNAEVDQMMRHVRAAARLWAPMQVTYGPAAIDAQAVSLRVSPAEPAAQLHGAVVAAAAAVLGDRATTPPQVPYWGHLAIAYANTRIEDGPLLGWLGAHPVEPVTMTVRAIHLVRQICRDHLFSWEPVARVPLG